MNRLPALLGVVAAVFLSACSQTTVGIPCEARADCAPGQECVTAPGGFCTRGCTEPGETRDCPVGTVCTFFGGDQQVCSPTCLVDSDCRPNFRCAVTGGNASDASACVPE